MTEPTTPPGWYPDPSGEPHRRYFDGKRWTEHRSTTPPPSLPPQNQPRHKRPGWQTAVIVAAVVLIAMASFSFLRGFFGRSGHSEPTVSRPAGVSDNPSSDSLSFPGKEAGDTGVKAGDTVTIDRVAMTTTPLFESDRFGSPAACTTVKITNNSDAAIFVKEGDWKIQNPRGQIDITFSYGDQSLKSGEIASGGGVTTGDVCVADSKHAGGTWVVLYDPQPHSTSAGRVGWVSQRTP